MPNPFKCEIKRNKKEYNEFTLTFTGMTAGKIMALRHALFNASASPVAADVYDAVEKVTRGDVLEV